MGINTTISVLGYEVYVFFLGVGFLANSVHHNQCLSFDCIESVFHSTGNDLRNLLTISS